MAPPKETGRHGGNPATRETDSARSGRTNPRAGRPEAQGNRIHRNRCQPAPTWTAPRGWHAVDLLDDCLSRWGRR